jgi:hypothetical protein
MTNRHDLTKYGIVALAAFGILGWVREPERHGSVDTPAAVSPARYTIVPDDDSSNPEVDQEQQSYAEPAEAAPVERLVTQQPRQQGRQQPRQQLRLDSSPAKPVVKIPVTRAKAETSVAAPVTVAQESGRHGGVEEGRTRPETVRESEPQPIREATVIRPDRSTASVVTPRQDEQRSRRRSTIIMAGAGAAGAAIGGATGGGKGAVIGAITGVAGGYVYDRMSRGSYRNGGGSGQPSDTGGSDLANRFGTPAFN